MQFEYEIYFSSDLNRSNKYCVNKPTQTFISVDFFFPHKWMNFSIQFINHLIESVLDTLTEIEIVKFAFECMNEPNIFYRVGHKPIPI